MSRYAVVVSNVEGFCRSEAFTIELNQLLLDCGFLKESEKDEARVAGDFDAAFAKFKADGLDLFSTRSWLLSKR